MRRPHDVNGCHHLEPALGRLRGRRGSRGRSAGRDAWRPVPDHHARTFTLLFGLPWGIALAATGWLRRGAAVTAGAVVTVSALTALGWSIGHSTEWPSAVPHFLAVAVVAALATALRCAATQAR
jgi:CHASE2 domain-containing sensor protein